MLVNVIMALFNAYFIAVVSSGSSGSSASGAGRTLERENRTVCSRIACVHRIMLLCNYGRLFRIRRFSYFLHRLFPPPPHTLCPSATPCPSPISATVLAARFHFRRPLPWHAKWIVQHAIRRHINFVRGNLLVHLLSSII